jgi:DNA-binding CsgD family transcriptional regulator
MSVPQTSVFMLKAPLEGDAKGCFETKGGQMRTERTEKRVQPFNNEDDVHRLLAQARDLAQGLERTLNLVAAAPVVPASAAEIDQRAVFEIRNAKQSIEMVATVPLSDTPSGSAIAATLCAAAARGAHVTILLSPHDLTHPRTPYTLEHFRRGGVLVRIAMHAPSITIMVVDRQLALVRPVRPEELGLIVKGTPIVTAIAQLSLAYWARSAAPPQGLTLAADPAKLSVEHRTDILELLVSGAKDEVAARRLGVSLRTYRRYVRQLMDELRANSRFEAGFLAAERGWYSLSPLVLKVVQHPRQRSSGGDRDGQ